MDFMKFMKHLAGTAGFTSCKRDLKARSGVAGAVQGTRAHWAWSFLCWKSILGGLCACLAPAQASPGGETLLASFLAPQGSVSSLNAESGVEVWGLGVQSCQTWHAWIREYPARHFSDGETEVQRRKEICPKSHCQLEELNQGPRCSDSHFQALSTVL